MSPTASTIKETVTGLDSLVDCLSADRFLNLPETKAHARHIISAAELDCRRSHCRECAYGRQGAYDLVLGQV